MAGLAEVGDRVTVRGEPSSDWHVVIDLVDLQGRTLAPGSADEGMAYLDRLGAVRQVRRTLLEVQPREGEWPLPETEDEP